MIKVRRKWAVCHDLWFDEPRSSDGADLVLFYHWSQPVNPAAARDVYSLQIDLTQSEAEILKGFTSSTRNQINRAVKDGFRFEVWTNPAPEIIREFFAFYAEFTRERGLGDEAVHAEWMTDYAEQGGILLTRGCDSDGRVLVWHSYYRNAQWVRQLQSISMFAGSDDKELRNAVGRANRYLHWMDILECRRLGIRNFDFGGVYQGQDDEKLLRVSAFKQEFGGVKTHRYHSILAVSLKGKSLLKARELRGKDNLIHIV